MQFPDCFTRSVKQHSLRTTSAQACRRRLDSEECSPCHCSLHLAVCSKNRCLQNLLQALPHTNEVAWQIGGHL